jgi:hypothetical protein
MTVTTNIPTIIPACVMEEIHNTVRIEKERQAEEERKAREERQRKLSAIILDSPLIPAINQSLAECGWCRLTIGKIKSQIKKHEIDFGIWYSDFYFDEMTNRFVFDFLIEQYRKAGYRIGGWGSYSRNYYKEEERVIFAEPNCNTCEL